ncbi:MAG: AMP-binding protein [Pseudomonadota bacterium]
MSASADGAPGAEARAPWRSFYGDRARALDAVAAPPQTRIERALTDAADRYGAAPFLTTVLPNGASATLTFAQVERRSRDFAAFLQSRPELVAGDVVAGQGPNCAAYVVAMFGALRAGFVLSNVNPLYTVEETRRQIADCNAKAVIFADLFGDRIDALAADDPRLVLVKFSVTEFFAPAQRAFLDFVLRRVKKLVPAMRRPHMTFADALTAGARRPFTPDDADGADPPTADFYQYSGGTTGRSKGVALTFSALTHNIDQVAALVPELLDRTGERTLLVMPLFHMFGFYVAVSTLGLGGELILAPSPRPLSNLKAAFAKFPPTVFPGVSTLFAHLLKEDWFKADPPRLELTVTGAMPMDPTVAAAWRETTGAEILESYGMTEATTVLTSNPPGALFRAGSVGLPVPGTDLRILAEDGGWAPQGEAGEIVAKGPQIMSGYIGDDRLNDDAFHEGWLRTGDIGYLDTDGYLFLVDRKKDMLIVSGFNVFPTEIEQALTEHPGVLEAAVVGVPDDKSGERAVAFVVADDTALTADALAAHCAERLTNYKRPKDYRFVDALPKTPVGKVLRRALRDALREGNP